MKLTLKNIIIAIVAAVVILYLGVFLLGLNLAYQWNGQMCHNKLMGNLEKLKTEIESSEFESNQSFLIESTNCWNKTTETVWVSKETEAKTCAEYCGQTKDFCTLLNYTNYEFDIRMCLDLPAEFITNIQITIE